MGQYDVEKVARLTRPTPADISPARPESAKTASSPKDAPVPMLRSRIAQRLNVPNRASRMSEFLEGLFRSPRFIQRANGPHEVRYVPPRLFARCGLARGTARLGAPGLGG